MNLSLIMTFKLIYIDLFRSIDDYSINAVTMPLIVLMLFTIK